MSRGTTRLIRSFKFASAGILHAFKTEQNIKIHVISAILVCIIATVLDVSKFEWMIILLLIGGIISLELVNTAVERTVDLVTNKEFHPLAKQAKDLSAGAVFIFALVSVMIGIIIFIHKIIEIIF
jgi:undecaprenol kinase